MCYNYEALTRAGIKRSIRDIGKEETMSSVTPFEKKIISSEVDLEPWSVFPGAEVAVIPIESQTQEFYFFGFLPSWAKEIRQSALNFNARADSLNGKPTWKKVWLKKQRCVVCATGFYEKDRATGKNYFFKHQGNKPMNIAGIYNHWANPETGEIIKTFAIITTEPNKEVKPFHDRMPVVLTEEKLKRWLDVNTTSVEADAMLVPLEDNMLEVREMPAPVKKKTMQKNNSQGSLDFG